MYRMEWIALVERLVRRCGFSLRGLLANEGRLRATGAKGVEYAKRFFARDYANNRLEFSL